jgi:hypothetical protein
MGADDGARAVVLPDLGVREVPVVIKEGGRSNPVAVTAG